MLQEPDAGSLITRWTNQHYVRQMNRRFKFNDAGLYLPAACLYGPLMLLDDIDALNDNPALTGKHSLNNSPSAPLIARDYFDGVTLFYPKHRHSTP
jgi:hypothetical protein